MVAGTLVVHTARERDAVPAPIRKLLLDSGCCPALLECYLEEGDVVYAAE